MNFKQVESVEEISTARELIEEYAAWLGVDLCFQGIEKELRELPGDYAPPYGRLLLAIDEDQVAGCVAIRKIASDICEMKRLYVRPPHRGRGLGNELATTIIDDARSIGYKKMRLDTLPGRMEKAVSMYHALGFKEIEAYYANPISGVLYLELEL